MTQSLNRRCVNGGWDRAVPGLPRYSYLWLLLQNAEGRLVGGAGLAVSLVPLPVWPHRMHLPFLLLLLHLAVLIDLLRMDGKPGFLTSGLVTV